MLLLKKSFTFTIFVLLFSNFCFAGWQNQYPGPSCAGKRILGNFEKVTILDRHLSLDAKLDTGAYMSSLTAQNITKYRRHKQIWLRFMIRLRNGTSHVMHQPLVDYAYVLRRKDDEDPNLALPPYAERPVVRLNICMDHQIHSIFVNLTDRSEFQYPMLLGRSALKKFHVLVDVSQKYLAQPCS